MSGSARNRNLKSSGMGESQQFPKHVPQYPLPNEILQMSRDETICQFCGVSYLIHNEIKKLEDRIAELEKELKDYEICKSKVKQLEVVSTESDLRVRELDEKVELKSRMITSLNKDIESAELERNRLSRKVQDYENENNYLIMTNENYKKKALKCDSLLKEAVMSLSQQKSEIKSLELAVKEQKNMATQYVLQIQSAFSRVLESMSREKSNNSEEISELNHKLDHAMRECDSAKDQLKFYTKQIETLQATKVELASQLSILSEELDKSKSVSSKYLTLQQEKRDLMQQNSELRDQVQSINQQLFDSKSRTDELSQKLNLNQESMESAMRLTEKELKLKTDEIQRLKNELDSLKRHLSQKDMFEKELISTQQLNSNEVKSLKNEIRRLNEQINDMSSEREAMTVAHQCQIQQLKDSFKEKYRSADDWREIIQAEMRDKQIEELKKQELSLRENFRIELEIQQQKYTEMYGKYQQLSKEFDHNYKHKLTEVENEKQRLIGEFKNLHEDKVSSEKRLRQEIENLRSIIKELHERMENNSENDSHSFKKSQAERENLISEFENEKRAQENQIHHLKEEIKILQETVHNECMERQELLEKLEETRDELLNLKKIAYSSSDKILPPLNTKINDENRRVANNKLPSPTYPRYLNEMENHRTRASSQSIESISSARRNSFTAITNDLNKSNSRADSNSAETNRSDKEKNNSRGGGAPMTHAMRREAALRQLSNEKNNTDGLPPQPIQLFKRINQLAQSNGGNTTTTSNSNKNTLTENKKRISLLIARK